MSQLIKWICPKCGITAKIRKFPVHCACGSVSRKLENTLSQLRLKICETCEQYNDKRCKLIELGCRPEFLRIVSQVRPRCPLGKWDKSIVINCDTHGYGDCITAAWIWQGAKEAGISLDLAATGKKAQLLKIFGIDAVEPTPEALRLSPTFSNDRRELTKSNLTRPQAWIEALGLPNFEPKRPTFTLSEKVQTKPYIVMCPQSHYPNREWSIILWRELARRVELEGHTVYFLGEPRQDCLDLPNWVSSEDWEFSVTLLAGAELVVGVDSAPVNVAGTCGVRCVVLLGPTTIDAYRHLEPIHWVTLPKQAMSCVGCWFNPPDYTAARCQSKCDALAQLSMMQVLGVIQSTKVKWQKKSNLLKPPINKSILNCNIHGLGDCITAIWLAYGSQNKIGLHADNKYTEMIELFGLPVYDLKLQNSIEKQYNNGMAHFDQLAQCYPPRLWLWAQKLGLDIDIVRPQHTLTKDELLAAPKYDILFFPETTHGSRLWIDVYWEELKDSLTLAGYNILVCGCASHNYQFNSYREMAATILNASLVVAVDSGPPHLSGTLGIPTVTLHGVTRPSVFAHLPSVQGIVIESRELPCVTCTYNQWQYTGSCDYQCAAMSILTPDRVMKVCNDVLKT